jgi:hypothetical protein
VSYEVRYTTRAAEQRDSLPPDGRRALAALENQLSSDPWSAGQEAKSEGAWYADFGDFGQAKYVIGDDGVVRVTVLFITWVG